MFHLDLQKATGVAWDPLDDEGTFAVAADCVWFPDGDAVGTFIESVGSKLRIFDDAEVLWHFQSHLTVPTDRESQIIFAEITRPFGVQLNEHGEFEIWSDWPSVQAAMKNFHAAMRALIEIEAAYGIGPPTDVLSPQHAVSD